MYHMHWINYTTILTLNTRSDDNKLQAAHKPVTLAKINIILEQ